MIVFITTVLILACFQSFYKLSLLSQRWIAGAALLAGLLPFLFEKRIAASSMLELNGIITDPAVLNNWCALIVIQELFALVAGFSLLADYSAEQKKAEKKFVRCCKNLKYAVFLPSFLLPAGIFYFQMYLFNRCTHLDFRQLSWCTSLCVSGGLALTAYGMKFIFREEKRRILSVFHSEYFLLLPAIFLPVAAHAKLVEATEPFDFSAPALLLLLFLFIVTVFTIIFYIIRKSKKGKFYVDRNSNS